MDYYKPGAHNVVCDRTGFKVKSTDVKTEWTGAIVRRSSFEKRHPQDFVKGKKERIGVKNARPYPEPRFLTTNEVSPSDL